MTWKRDINAIIELHREGSKAYDKHNGRILYQYATGSGKSKQAIDNILKDKEWWVILCWEVAHINNWKEEFKKWKAEHLIEGDTMRVHIICYAAMRQYFSTVDSTYKINMVCDEAHHAFSETYFPYVERHAKKLQMLTATMPQDQLQRMRFHPTLKDMGHQILTLNQAIKRNILPTPGIFLVSVTFDSMSRNKLLHIHKGARVKWEKMSQIQVSYPNYRKYMKQTPLNMMVYCTEAELMEYHNNQVEYFKQQYFTSKDKFRETQMKLAGANRKRFIAEVKTEKAREFIEKFVGDSRAIIFCGSVDQAESLGGDNVMSSRMTTKQNREKLAEFQDGKINRLYTNRMLREGMNLSGIEKAVIIQLDNKNLAFVQMAGRALRSDFPELFIFHAPLTQDDKYLQNSLKGINREFVKSIEQYGKEEEQEAPALVQDVLLGLD